MKFTEFTAYGGIPDTGESSSCWDPAMVSTGTVDPTDTSIMERNGGSHPRGMGLHNKGLEKGFINTVKQILYNKNNLQFVVLTKCLEYANILL